MSECIEAVEQVRPGEDDLGNAGLDGKPERFELGNRLNDCSPVLCSFVISFAINSRWWDPSQSTMVVLRCLGIATGDCRR
jgi:hypothetical protein